MDMHRSRVSLGFLRAVNAGAAGTDAGGVDGAGGANAGTAAAICLRTRLMVLVRFQPSVFDITHRVACRGCAACMQPSQ